MFERIISVVIAEWSFESSFVRRRVADQSKLRFGGEAMREPERVLRHFNFSPASNEASTSSGTSSGSGAMAASINAGGPPRNTVTGNVWSSLLRFAVVKAAAFLNLPVQPGCLSIVDLHAIDAEVVLFGHRIFGVNERQSDKRAAVLLPRREHWQLIESRGPIYNLLLPASAMVFVVPSCNNSKAKATMLPQFSRAGRQQRFRDLHQLANDCFRLWSKG